MDRNSLEELEVVVRERLPLELSEVHVVSEIDSQVHASGNGPAGMLEFLFVDVDWDIGTHKVFEATGMIKMQVTEDNGLDVFDVVTGRLDGGRQLVFILIDNAWKDIRERCTPFLFLWSISAEPFRESMATYHFNILSTTSLEEDQASLGMLDQDREHHKIASLVFGILIT